MTELLTKYITTKSSRHKQNTRKGSTIPGAAPTPMCLHSTTARSTKNTRKGSTKPAAAKTLMCLLFSGGRYGKRSKLFVD